MAKVDLSSYPRYKATAKVDPGALAAWRVESKFRQVNPPDVPDSEITNVFATKNDEYDFGPFLAESEPGEPAFPKRVSSDEAASYMRYRAKCKAKGVEPGDFVDMRVVVTGRDDGGKRTAQEEIAEEPPGV
jgi:hypothetical protein